MKRSTLVLPALRGQFGDWIYYSCQFPLRELGQRVEYAQDIHRDRDLSKLIQRALEGKRASRIAEYITKTPDRFFNSLVLATYGGDPQWLEVGNLKSRVGDGVVEKIPREAIESIGFLHLNGNEQIFAVDGQHRLAGIKKALQDGAALQNDEVPVLLIGHKKTDPGLRRTRRLFTTLNKTAVPVVKRDIIALDEDDVMAITARRLVEQEAWFQSPKIAVIDSTSLPSSNLESLTTISNLYDILKRVFEHEIGQYGSMADDSGMARGVVKLRFNRPSDERLDQHYRTAKEFFTALAETFPPVGSLFRSKAPGRITPRYRHDTGGHVLFRPVGLEIVTRLAIDFARHHKVGLPEAVAALALLPVELANAPYCDVIWNPRRQLIVLKGKDLALNLGRHLLRLPFRGSAADLRKRYQDFVEDPHRLLPDPIV